MGCHRLLVDSRADWKRCRRSFRDLAEAATDLTARSQRTGSMEGQLRGDVEAAVNGLVTFMSVPVRPKANPACSLAGLPTTSLGCEVPVKNCSFSGCRVGEPLLAASENN